MTAPSAKMPERYIVNGTFIDDYSHTQAKVSMVMADDYDALAAAYAKAMELETRLLGIINKTDIIEGHKRKCKLWKGYECDCGVPQILAALRDLPEVPK